MTLIALVSTSWAGSVACLDSNTQCYGTLQQALDAAEPGDTVRISSPSLAEAIAIVQDVTILGAPTQLVPAAVGVPSVTVADGVAASFEELSVRASDAGGVAVGVGATLQWTGGSLQSAAFTSSGANLLVSEGGSYLFLQDLVIAAEFPVAGAIRPGAGLRASALRISGTYGGAVLTGGDGASAWDVTDIWVVDVSSGGPAVEVLGQPVIMERVAVRCLAAPGPGIAVDSPEAQLGPLLVWKGTVDPLVELSGSGSVRHITLHTPASTALSVASGTWVVTASALRAPVGFVGAGNAFVDASYNVYDADTIAMGTLTSSSVGGTGVLAEPIDFMALDSTTACDGDVLAPAVGSVLVDAGPPAEADVDGSASDVGATGGPLGFELLVDNDGDGFANVLDCDDSDAAINPDAAEVAHDGVDQDCDGMDLLDADGDGFDASFAGGLDCDDDNAAVHPDASDPRGGPDLNCDGYSGPSSALDYAGWGWSCGHAASPGSVGLFLISFCAVRRRTRES